MYLEQLSVFVENRVSRINDVLLTLKKNNINVLSLSLADTSEYGLLRLIVDQPETGRSVLKEEGFSVGGFHAVNTTNVLKGSGMSSSAAFEILICTILNDLYNDSSLAKR